MQRVNRRLPDSYGLSATVYVPTASETNPIDQNDPLVWTGIGNSAAPAAAGDPIQLRAKHRLTSPTEPLGVHIYGFSRIETWPYTGAAPALGASVVADGAGGVTGVDAAGAAVPANGSRVLYVDTAAGVVDVAMP